MVKLIALTNAWTGLPIAFNPAHVVAIYPVEEKPNDKAVPGSEYGPKMKVETYIMTSGNDDGGFPVAEKFDIVYERMTSA